jgi:hypothetical protein
MRFFNKKSFHLFVMVFLCIPPGWESYIYDVRVGRGGLSQRVLSASYWLHFFKAIRIRVNDYSLPVWLSSLGVPHKTTKLRVLFPHHTQCLQKETQAKSIHVDQFFC